MTTPLRVIAVTRKPHSASFQQRVLNYLHPLRDLAVHVSCQTLPTSLLAQRKFLFSLADADVIWWHRHLLNPLLLPRLTAARRPVVFDFDDPLPFSSHAGGRPSFTRRLRFARLLRRCRAAFPASHYLADLARPYCPDLLILPMAVDLPADLPPLRPLPDNQTFELLWLGSAVTQPYLETIRPALEQLGRHPRLRLRLVAHQPVSFGSLPVDFRPWSPAEQDSALRQCHLGLCPMPDTVWTRGKCPYKVLQYMSFGIPWIGSSVGENLRIAADQPPTGLCAATPADWVRAIELLLANPRQRAEMGQAGRAYVQRHHARPALAQRIAVAFRQLAATPASLSSPPAEP